MFWRMRGIPSGVFLVFDVPNIAADLTVAWLGPNALVPLPSSRERESTEKMRGYTNLIMNI